MGAKYNDNLSFISLVGVRRVLYQAAPSTHQNLQTTNALITNHIHQSPKHLLHPSIAHPTKKVWNGNAQAQRAAESLVMTAT